MIGRRLFSQFDYPLFGGTLLMSLIGLLGIYSATTHGADDSLFFRQVIWLSLGVCACLAMLLIDYHILVDNAMVLYLLTALVLLGVLFFGTEVNGSRSWIRVAGFGAQPSELAKIVLVLALANYLSGLNQNYLGRRHLVTLAGLTLLPVVLVTLQGDLGTALTFFPILLGTALVAGVRARFLMGLLILALCVAPIGWFTLKEYQKQRIRVTLNPDLDPSGVGYQTNQSLIAIGSGGMTGKGFGNGLQSQLGFVPESHSDFIFALLAEERGFLGGAFILLLYLFGLQRLVRIGETSRDRAGILVVTGVASLICFHVVVNVGMTLGIMPAIGIPLPLLSYGGSATISSFVGLGLALNVHSRRFVYFGG